MQQNGGERQPPIYLDFHWRGDYAFVHGQYTTIPNKTNSKSVAAKHVLTRIAANRVVDTHEEPIASIGCPYLKVDIYYFLMAVEDSAL